MNNVFGNFGEQRVQTHTSVTNQKHYQRADTSGRWRQIMIKCDIQLKATYNFPFEHISKTVVFLERIGPCSLVPEFLRHTRKLTFDCLGKLAWKRTQPLKRVNPILLIFTEYSTLYFFKTDSEYSRMMGDGGTKDLGFMQYCKSTQLFISSPVTRPTQSNKTWGTATSDDRVHWNHYHATMNTPP